ncbi:YjiH family protein [Kocuria marina]|uniref:YjiH family protein n=1 Tax=Kocuria marina TaxID=223184 RepID=UPI0022E13628|nr:YjiH family protein [Kocuria marina]
MSRSHPDATPPVQPLPHRAVGVTRFLVYSLIGAVMFFVPVTIGARSTIPLDHIVGLVRAAVPQATVWYALVVILIGAVVPFATGRWRRTRTDTVFALLNVVGLVVGAMIVLRIGPAWLLAEDMGPYLYNSVVVPVGLIVPIGSIFLALLTHYGLMEFCGVFLQRLMRPLWHTPGRASIDAVASFVGSYSLGLLITGQMYREGRYTAREAAIIATGFSTVSATFMIIVAKTLGLMDRWNLYFWSTLVITFVVTALTVRVWPLQAMPQQYHPQAVPDPEEPVRGQLLRRAWVASTEAAVRAGPLHRNAVATFRTGITMATTILPIILSVGLIALVLARFTPVFEWVGYLFWPIIALMGLPDADVVATGAAASLADMFVPAILAAQLDPAARWVMGILCISEIIFFSGVVPCIHATGIPLGMGRLVVVWAERVALTLVLAIPFAYLVT